MRITAISRFRLLDLPVEIVEDVILHLTPPVILGLRVVSPRTLNSNLASLTDLTVS